MRAATCMRRAPLAQLDDQQGDLRKALGRRQVTRHEMPGRAGRARRLQRSDGGERAHGREAPRLRARDLQRHGDLGVGAEQQLGRAGVSVTVVAGAAASAASASPRGCRQRGAARPRLAAGAAPPREPREARASRCRAGRGQSSCETGSVRRKTVAAGSLQRPGIVQQLRDPRPMLRAISRLTARPSPVPCSSPLVVKNDSNSRWADRLGDPGAVVGDLDDREARVLRAARAREPGRRDARRRRSRPARWPAG